MLIYEWIGPKISPIYEVDGGRGDKRTSIDAFLLAIINGKLTQILMEWKFTETYLKPEYLNRFSGIRGNERLIRYTTVLAELRKSADFPFKMQEEGGWGLADLGYEPIYQLLRMTLLARKNTPIKLLENLVIEDYRILHLTHSFNQKFNELPQQIIQHHNSLFENVSTNFHRHWSENILAETETQKFKFGYWDKAVSAISEDSLRDYLTERYI